MGILREDALKACIGWSSNAVDSDMIHQELTSLIPMRLSAQLKQQNKLDQEMFDLAKMALAIEIQSSDKYMAELKTFRGECSVHFRANENQRVEPLSKWNPCESSIDMSTLPRRVPHEAH